MFIKMTGPKDLGTDKVEEHPYSENSHDTDNAVPIYHTDNVPCVNHTTPSDTDHAASEE